MDSGEGHVEAIRADAAPPSGVTPSTTTDATAGAGASALPDTVRLDPESTLRLAFRHSRALQARRDSLAAAALDLLEQRRAFGPQLSGELADETHEQAYWDMAPNLNGTATHGYNYGRVIDRFTNTFATDRVRTNNFYLSSTITLFQGLQKQGTIKRTELDAQAALLGIEAARNNVRLEVVQAFLDVLGLAERVSAAESQAASTRGARRSVQRIHGGGRAAGAVPTLLALESQLAQEEHTSYRPGQPARPTARWRFARALAVGCRSEMTHLRCRKAPAITAPCGSWQPQRPLRRMKCLDNSSCAAILLAQAETRVASAERSIGVARNASPCSWLNGSAWCLHGRDIRCGRTGGRRSGPSVRTCRAAKRCTRRT